MSTANGLHEILGLIATARANGADLWHADWELATWLTMAQRMNVKTVLELGTLNGDLAKLMQEGLGWQVTSIDVNPPKYQGMEFIQATTIEARGIIGDRRFDLIFIDADHDGHAPMIDHLLYKDSIDRMVVFHDTELGRACCQGSAEYWHQISRDADGKIRDDYDEAEHGIGTGWYFKTNTIECPHCQCADREHCDRDVQPDPTAATDDCECARAATLHSV